jgi:hypothetical protein
MLPRFARPQDFRFQIRDFRLKLAILGLNNRGYRYGAGVSPASDDSFKFRPADGTSAPQASLNHQSQISI